MYKWLEAHPDIGASLRKETDFFSNRYGLGVDWYRAHFASNMRHRTSGLRGRRLVTFEATPVYLSHPLAPQRAANLVPSAKLVALLRNPADRAISHYQHLRRLNREPLDLEAALSAEPGRVTAYQESLRAHPLRPIRGVEGHWYLTRGRYAEQLERWIAAFDRSQLLVVRSEDMYREPARVYAEVLEFLGVRDWTPRRFNNFSYGPQGAPSGGPTVSPDVRTWLGEHFDPHNQRLYDLIGRDFGWA